MNCHRVQNLLSAYLDQEISSEERRQIRNHIFNCSACSRSYEELTSIKNYLGSLEPPSFELNFFNDFNLCHHEFVNHLNSNPFMWSKRLLLTSGCVFLFLLTSFYLFPTSDPKAISRNQEITSATSKPNQYHLVRQENTEPLIENKEQEEEKEDYFLEKDLLLPGIPVSR